MISWADPAESLRTDCWQRHVAANYSRTKDFSLLALKGLCGIRARLESDEIDFCCRVSNG